MKFIREKISHCEFMQIAHERFGDMIKAVVDIRLEVMIVGGDLHSDEEAALLESGSNQIDLWGINIYVDKSPDERVEFDSVINIRPAQNNRSRDVIDPLIRKKIVEIVNKFIE
ncbi:hypothetical protein HYV57_03025 [Candidatus Peregrinibacteria bacterium]|nr:hypothetical protein [Candidatus Peregrinibacteria bacterium]